MSGRTGDAAAPDCSLSRGTMLRLRIVSDHRRSLAERSSATFSVEGGTIGRSADNDWVLPDPRRYVSAHHARVQFREGHFYLQDVSTNGVYVNDDMEPLAKRGSSGYRLADGDILRMGEYHIVAALEARQAREDAAAAVPTSIHGLRTLGRAADHDIGAPLDLQELLLPADDTDSVSALPVSAYGQSVDSDRVRALGRTREPEYLPEVQPQLPLPDDTDPRSFGERMARLAEAVGRDPRNGASAIALEDVRTGLERGAGRLQGSGAQQERNAQPLSHRIPATGARRPASVAGRLRGRGAADRVVRAARRPPARLGAVAARSGP